VTTASAIDVNTILNRVAVEVGLDSVTDPYGSTEKHFTQMIGLLQVAGEELALAYEWEFLTKTHQITTVAATDTGDYDLPTDFHYMIPQTGWERANNVPLGGPLTAQDWTYLLGRDLATQTIYASFRLRTGKFSIFPQPPPDALDINFEYQSKNWLTNAAGDEEKYDIDAGTNIVLYDRTLITRYLKLKFLESKGFDTTKAQDSFNQIFGFLTGKDKSAPILSAGGMVQYPYLDSHRNIADTGFGT